MLSFLALGTLLGLSAGLAPGPLLALVLSETLTHGVRSGLRVCLAPLLTDLPIVAVSLLLLSRLAGAPAVLGALSLLGAALVFWFGVQNLRTLPVRALPQGERPRSLRKGVLVNMLSPHPYLFWLGVGGPAAVRAARSDLLWAAGFVASFYLLLVGSKMVVAVAAGHSRGLLSTRGYVLTMRALGLALCLFSLLLARDGLRLLTSP
jgi:threonine/homoserine/homoserine lactone efflux protein